MDAASGRVPGCRNLSESWSAPSSAYVKRTRNDLAPSDRITDPVEHGRLEPPSRLGVLAFSRLGRSIKDAQGHFTAPAKRLRAEPAGYWPNGDLTDSFVPKRRKSRLSKRLFG